MYTLLCLRASSLISLYSRYNEIVIEKVLSVALHALYSVFLGISTSGAAQETFYCPVFARLYFQPLN